MKINKGEIQYIVKPISFLGILIILLVLLGTIGTSQIKSVIAKNNEAKKTETNLKDKVLVLQKVSEVIAGDTTFLDLVIPNKGAVLYGINQVKSQAVKSNLFVSNMKSGATIAEKDKLSKISITFDIEGQEASIYGFLDSFNKALPLMTIEKVKLNKNGAIARATVTLDVYTAELPTNIPSVTSSANDLTAEEITLLKELITYTLPNFVTPEAQKPLTKPDPFN